MAHIDSSRPVSGRHCAPQRPDLLDTFMKSCHQSHFVRFFFFLDARKLNVLNVCRSGFFFFLQCTCTENVDENENVGVSVKCPQSSITSAAKSHDFQLQVSPETTN